jgi:uncharacterized protein YbjT (DUF2867 family)
VARILVTGATGNIGSEVLTQLHAVGRQVRAVTRRPHAANFPHDVEVCRGDLTAPDTLDACLDDVDAIFLVWMSPLAAAAPALARIARRVARIVLLTSPHKTMHPFFQQPNAMRSVHAGVEQLIERSGVQWTFLRPHVFALNCLNWWAPQIRNGNVVRWFHGDAATAPIDERDIAAVAVRALCDEGHVGREYVLTGPESLTQRELLQIIGSAIGRPLQFQELSPEAVQREVLTEWPPAVANMLLSAYGAAIGLPALITSTVFDVTGKPALSFREWASKHARDFLAGPLETPA